MSVVPFPLQREKGEKSDHISEIREGNDFLIDPDHGVLRINHRREFIFVV